MAFDGITIANITKELREALTGGRLYKIAQPEPDELLLTIKNASTQYRLLLSASAALPLLYLTDKNKPSPISAPNFCMLLRKHLQNGRIRSITQPGLERIVNFEIEHLDEMGDLCRKLLIVELMGKHSNIIFCNDSGIIIDSIKHISGMVSSVREVLPGKEYFIPHTQDKENPLSADSASLPALLSSRPMPVYKALYTSYTGFSPVIAQQLCYDAGVDADLPCSGLSPSDWKALSDSFGQLCERIRQEEFSPSIIYNQKVPEEYSALPLTMYADQCHSCVYMPTMSSLLETYYAEKSAVTRIRQKSTDLRRIVQTALERSIKKYDLQRNQIKDTKKKETYRVYGELINTYGYSVAAGSNSMEALNYYTNETITIPLDPFLTPAQNAKKYFDKYQKLKRTYEALSQLTLEVKAEIDHLESISNSLDIALSEEDLVPIREELIESGYIRRKGGSKTPKITSRPLHYISSDGYHIYVGKNNYQNDEITFKLATGNDWWFHAKGIPGSHVLVKTIADTQLPDSTFEEAARLAAYYSKARGQDKVEIDYIQKKHVKKTTGGALGFVIYHTNYSMMIDSDISGIEQLPA